VPNKSFSKEQVFSILAETPAHILALMVGLESAQLQTPSARDEWSAALGEILQVFIDVEDVILRGCLDAQIVQQPEKLRAMIGAVIGHMQQHLPQDKLLVLSP
jgi:hypothetical protein